MRGTPTVVVGGQEIPAMNYERYKEPNGPPVLLLSPRASNSALLTLKKLSMLAQLQEETCGGVWAFSLHKLDGPEAPTDNSEYVGCFRDTRDDRVMTDKTTSNGMDPVLCREYCVDRDALYYGTQVHTVVVSLSFCICALCAACV